MTRLNLLLVLAVLASALYLVNLQYESRRLFSALDKAHGEARRLETDRERLHLEKLAQATPSRVEKLARERLQMRGATPAIIHYVASGAQPAASAAATAANTVSGGDRP